jgi:RNA polymerase sigma-70 factor (ECF subfamily)
MSTSISADRNIDSWYRRYAPQLRSAARRIVGNREDADDAIQEAFLAAFRAFPRYDGSDPYPWLHRIATRKALTIVTSRRPAVSLVDDISPPAPSAEDVALARSWSGHLHDLVTREPAVALHLIAGLRFREIGERCGMPPATAATRVRRGKARLRSALAATLRDLPESKSA